jgi:hypothetical protein
VLWTWSLIKRLQIHNGGSELRRFAEPSGGLEPPTHSLPRNLSGNLRANDSPLSEPIRRPPICQRLIALAMLRRSGVGWVAQTGSALWLVANERLEAAALGPFRQPADERVP